MYLLLFWLIDMIIVLLILPACIFEYLILLPSWWDVISGSFLRIMASAGREELASTKVKRRLMKRWQSATSCLCKIRRCTCICILQGMHGILFQCYVSTVMLDGKVSPKAWWECLLHKWLMHMKLIGFMVVMMKWCTWYWKGILLLRHDEFLDSMKFLNIYLLYIDILDVRLTSIILDILIP